MNKKAFPFIFFCWLFALVSIPVGALENIKLTILTLLTLAFFITLPKLKIPIVSLISIIFFVTLLLLQSLNTLISNFDDSFVFIEARSILLILITITYYLILSKNQLVKHESAIKTFIYGVLGFAFFKIIITYAIFNNPALIESMDLLDFYPIGNLGHPGILRFVFINDFFIPFAYFLTVKSEFPKLTKNMLITIFFIMGIMSMTRYIWLILAIIIMLIHKWNLIIFTLIALIFSSILSNEYTDFKIIDSLNHRAFIEGADSVSEKSTQSSILLEEASNYPVFGKGLGTYVEGYIRNERIKYGYEVFYFLLILQFGLPILLIILSFIYWKLMAKLRRHSFKIKNEAFWIYTLILGSGFFNPTIMSAGTVVIFIAINEYYCGLGRNYKSH